jgi:hypothetical protein
VNSYRGAEKEWVDLDTADHTGAELVVYLYDTTGGVGVYARQATKGRALVMSVAPISPNPSRVFATRGGTNF